MVLCTRSRNSPFFSSVIFSGALDWDRTSVRAFGGPYSSTKLRERTRIIGVLWFLQRLDQLLETLFDDLCVRNNLEWYKKITWLYMEYLRNRFTRDSGISIVRCIVEKIGTEERDGFVSSWFFHIIFSDMNLWKFFKYLLWWSIALLFIGGFLWNCTFGMDSIKCLTRMHCWVSHYMNGVNYITAKYADYFKEKMERKIESEQEALSGVLNNFQSWIIQK